MARSLRRLREARPPASAQAVPLPGAAAAGRRRASSGTGRALRRFRLSRIGAAYCLLALALGGAAVGAGLALTRAGGSRTSAAAASSGWSSWRPAGIGSTAVREIARHVAGEYRMPNGQQLLNVIAHQPMLASGLQKLPISALEIEPDTGAGRNQVVLIGQGVMYILCGGAPDCSLPQNMPQAAGLERRESLQLALYTFKYVDGIDTVLAVVPAAHGSKTFLVLRRADVAPYLDRPLAATIGRDRTVRVPPGLGSGEVRSVARVTLPHEFVVGQSQQLPDGTLALLLSPAPLTALGGA